MPQVEHQVRVAASIDDVWDFVKDMDNWAPLLTGYDAHEKLSEAESVWHMRGELGGMTRTADFRVMITEWNGPEQVLFELHGLSEPVSGGGAFLAATIDDAEAEPRLDRGWAARVAELVAGLFGRRRERAPRARSVVTLRLSLEGSGGIGQLLNLLIAPMLKPVAVDFARRIGEQVEARALAKAKAGK